MAKRITDTDADKVVVSSPDAVLSVTPKRGLPVYAIPRVVTVDADGKVWDLKLEGISPDGVATFAIRGNVAAMVLVDLPKL